ncbi:Hemin uptake protein HemP [Nitrosospira multiformis]|uniref:Hemin uptake protein HemP n=2 Tax=Nitrosospira multiformis TaxID=1231 RepID=A0A1I0C6G1_9PROT|nr:Hemin uptake protein HemP [Nitrosospira multiformis]
MDIEIIFYSLLAFPPKLPIIRIILINNCGNGAMDKLLTVPETNADKQKFVMLDRTRRIYSDALFSHGDEVFIQHQGEQYRLRRTRNGKLILTK